MTEMMDVVILSNGPGEVTTWVYPFVKALADRKDLLCRISVVLSPCSHASGNEAAIVQSYPGVERVLAPDRFWQFLLWGKTPGWDWLPQGVVIFLGGDQFFTVVIGKRLGYRTVVYAEWEARWTRWIDRFALRHEGLLDRVGSKGVVIGDLMTDIPRSKVLESKAPYMVLLPGSKAMKLWQGVPLMLGVTDRLVQHFPDWEFYIALAPTLPPQELEIYGKNPNRLEGPTAELLEEGGEFMLVTAQGTKVKIYRPFPATELFLGAKLCLTTVGANTAQLGALGVPMVVVLPTNQWDSMRAWDGIGGILGNLPGVGSTIASMINRIVVAQIKRQGKFLAWPNIWAKKPIVPEYLGHLTCDGIATEIKNLIDHPEQLDQINQSLSELFPPNRSGESLVDIIKSLY